MFLYLCLLVLLSVASVLASLVSVAPYPNSIVLYLFAIIGVSYAAQSWLGSKSPPPPLLPAHTHTVTVAPMVISLPALLLYSTLVPIIIYTFPKSFTLAEAVVVVQALVVMLVDVLLQVLLLVC